jgi:predicted flap endonuclease-1-like 5' DNA nuclease
MISTLSLNAVPIVIALLIGLAIAWWLFRRAQPGRGSAPTRVTSDRPSALPRTVSEGEGLADEHAAATADIAGEMLGVDVHAQLPGASGPPDNLQIMKGVGPKLADKLNEHGIIRYDQLASLTPQQVASLDARMDPFRGRLARDRLVEQAGYLARGDRDGFEARFGRLGN